MAQGENNRAAEIVLKVDSEGVGLVRSAAGRDRPTRESEREGCLKSALGLHHSPPRIEPAGLLQCSGMSPERPASLR
jgi:hypothetical protein